jgi:hypothetical protein
MIGQLADEGDRLVGKLDQTGMVPQKLHRLRGSKPSDQIRTEGLKRFTAALITHEGAEAIQAEPEDLILRIADHGKWIKLAIQRADRIDAAVVGFGIEGRANIALSMRL